MRVNVGCGQSPTAGFRNFDNSLSLVLARIPLLPALLRKAGLLDSAQHEFLSFARSRGIEHADAARRLPLEDRSVDVLYSSHMLEHLDREEAAGFLREAMRVLRPGGVLRIAVPDLRKEVSRYGETGDADAFVAGLLVCQPKLKTLRQKLQFLLVGPRHHHWMYDGASLCGLLRAHGFVNTETVAPGRTRIPEPGALDLFERSSESVFVEADRP